MADFVNSFTKKLRDTNVRLLRRATEAKAMTDKAFKNINIAQLSKTMTFSASAIFDDTEAESSGSSERANDLTCEEISTGDSPVPDSPKSQSPKKVSGSVAPLEGPGDGGGVKTHDHNDHAAWNTVQVSPDLETDVEQLRVLREKKADEDLQKREDLLRKKDEEAATRLKGYEHDISDTLHKLEDTLQLRSKFADRVREEQQAEDAGTKQQEDEGIKVNSAEVDTVEEPTEFISALLDGERQRAEKIAMLQRELEREQQERQKIQDKVRLEQQNLIKRIPERFKASQKTAAGPVGTTSTTTDVIVEDQTKIKKKYEPPSPDKTEQGWLRMSAQVAKGLVNQKEVLEKNQKEADAKIAAIRQQQREEQQKMEDLQAEEHSIQIQEADFEMEEEVKKLDDMRKANEKRESRLCRLRERLPLIEKEDDIIASPVGVGDCFQTPAFRPERHPQSTQLNLDVDTPVSGSGHRQGLRGDGGTFNVPEKFPVQGRVGLLPVNHYLKTGRSEFEKTVMEAGGVTLEEQEKLDLEDQEDQEMAANTSTVSFMAFRTKEEIPVFSGDIVDYRDWKLSFRSLISQFPKPEHLDTLKIKLCEKAILIAGCTGRTDSALKRAWGILDSTFGRPERVRAILLAQIEGLVSVPFINTTKFVYMVRQLRDKFDRLLRVDGLSVIGVNNHILVKFLRSMPAWLARKIMRLAREEHIQWTFNAVLKLAEKAVEDLQDQDWWLNDPGPLGYQEVPSQKDCDKRRPRREACNAINTTDPEDHEDYYEEEEEVEEYTEDTADVAVHQIQGGNRGVGAGRGLLRGAGSRGRGTVRGAAQGALRSGASQGGQQRGHIRPDMKNPFAKCMVCDCEDHKTVHCKVATTMDPAELKVLTKVRRICELCGRPGHRSLHCPFYTVSENSTLACRSEVCSSNPHTMVFCNINKKT